MIIIIKIIIIIVIIINHNYNNNHNYNKNNDCNLISFHTTTSPIKVHATDFSQVRWRWYSFQARMCVREKYFLFVFGIAILCSPASTYLCKCVVWFDDLRERKRHTSGIPLIESNVLDVKSPYTVTSTPHELSNGNVLNEVPNKEITNDFIEIFLRLCHSTTRMRL